MVEETNKKQEKKYNNLVVRSCLFLPNFIFLRFLIILDKEACLLTVP